MDITLRRAAALQDAIRETLRGLNLAGQTQVSIFGDVAEAARVKRAEFRQTLKAQADLNTVLFEIRQLVGQANVESGISDLLAIKAHVAAEISTLSALEGLDPAEPDEALAQRAARAATAETSSGFGGARAPIEKITVSLMDAEALEAVSLQASRARKARLEVGDRLAELNASTRIKLSAQVTEILTRHGLV